MSSFGLSRGVIQTQNTPLNFYSISTTVTSGIIPMLKRVINNISHQLLMVIIDDGN